MSGILSYGAYVPLRRLGAGARSEKAVANWDEDSLTLAVAAATDCLAGIGRDKVDGLYFATTTPPYAEKLAATTAAWAIDLRRDILTADVTDSLRAGTAALKMALDTVKAGSGRSILVTASDLRMGSGNLDGGFGDGAAAFLVGDKDVIAEIEGSYSLSNELLDVWRAGGAKTVRSWEDRFVFEEGYLKVLPQAVKNFFEKYKLSVKDIDKLVLYGPDLRRHRQMVGELGFKPEQVQDAFFDKLGNTGTAFVPMLLVAALEDAKPGDRILVAAYGDGADILLLKVTDKIKNVSGKWGMKRSLASRMMLPGLADYQAYRAFASSDPEQFGGASASVIARERDEIYALHGVKCLTCGTVQYPPQRICTRCHTKDNFEPYSFADKKGKVFTFTLKYGGDIPGFARPMVDTMVDFEGGGRALFGMTDMVADKVTVGMDVEMSFRTLGAGGGIRNYFWRCMPPRSSWPGKETK
ncbi:MAG: 3-oxoacyl-[acyl-carrier-protein] synthase III C-terminal domain-containing protein [Dehalococcoidales bacterium]|jgi:3-hydroxy-3-methylglutaryl CoA synthase